MIAPLPRGRNTNHPLPVPKAFGYFVRPMRRATVGASRALLGAARGMAATLLVLSPAGCGKAKPAEHETLEIESAPDSATLTQGKSILTSFEPYRASDGALRARGKLALPDGTRLQLSVKRHDGVEIGRVQLDLRGGGFDTPPIFDQGRVPPTASYRFELSVQFNHVWQPDNVLAETGNGLTLRGPGVHRGNHGEAIFESTLERRL